jgi:hypothetical protein
VSGAARDLLQRTSWHISIHHSVMEQLHVEETTWFGVCRPLQLLSHVLEALNPHPDEPPCTGDRPHLSQKIAETTPLCHSKTVSRPTILTSFTCHHSQPETPSLHTECKFLHDGPGRGAILTGARYSGGYYSFDSLHGWNAAHVTAAQPYGNVQCPYGMYALA